MVGPQRAIDKGFRGPHARSLSYEQMKVEEVEALS